ncbi:MAG: hypothetical protein P1U46_02125 [Patescibacteria group bacterium]|nr:hypothetical protein [Patescibacteria group bacterium]
MEILCFSHQLSFNHLSPIIVSIHLSKSKTKSALAFLSAFSNSSFVAFGLEKRRFSFIEALNKLLS